MTRAYEEVIDFIAGRDPKGVAEFQPSEEALRRFRDLLARQKDETITPEEAAELDTYLDLEHIMRLAKARACQRLGDE
jgi:hypothetical protein